MKNEIQDGFHLTKYSQTNKKTLVKFWTFKTSVIVKKFVEIHFQNIIAIKKLSYDDV